MDDAEVMFPREGENTQNVGTESDSETPKGELAEVFMVSNGQIAQGQDNPRDVS